MSAPSRYRRWTVRIALLGGGSAVLVGLALVLDWLSRTQIHYLAS